MQTFRRPNGFTLIELMVVISIVALLVAILLPSLGRARESVRRAVCGSQLHQVGLANGGRGDRGGGVWGYLYDYSGYADNKRPILRVQDTTRPEDTAIMTDLFRGESPGDASGTYIRYIDNENGAHDRVAGNHPEQGDALRRSEGLNVLTVDQGVRWKPAEETIYRYPRQYNYMYG